MHSLKQLHGFGLVEKTFRTNFLFCRFLAGFYMRLRSELYGYHPFAGERVPHDYASKESLLGSKVVEGEILVDGIFVEPVSDFVVEVVHQGAVAYRQHFVEGSADMETDTRFKGNALAQLFCCQPLLVAAAKVQFVAILTRLLTSEYGLAFGQFHLANAL